MDILKTILIVIYVIVCLILVVICMKQSKDDEGLSSTITGSSTNNFFEKNKGKTKQGRLVKWTIILGSIFAVMAIVLNAIYLF